MKIFIKTFILFFVLLLPVTAFAQTRGQVTTLPAGQTVNGNYFGAGGTVRVDGTVNGDAYVAGGTVTVNGTVNGDVIAAGGTVTINGTVTGNIRAAGGTVTVGDDVGRNVTIGGGTATIDKNAHIHGTAVIGAGSVNILGRVDKDATLGGGTATISGDIGGNASVNSDQVILTPGAKINGTLAYTSANNAEIDKGATVSGKIQRTLPPASARRQQRTSAISAFIWGKIISFVALYLIGLLFITYFPRFTGQTVAIVKNDAWKSIGLGLLILIVTPLVALFLFITLVGIPFGIAVIFMYIILLYIGKIFVAMFLGEWAAGLMKKKLSPAWGLFVGLLLHFIITLIPVLGWIAGVFIMLWGMGAYTLAERDMLFALRKKDLL